MRLFSGLRQIVKTAEEVAGYLRAQRTMGFNFWQTHGKPPDDSQQALIERYTSWAYVCASRNAAAVASVELKLYATKATGEMPARRAARSISRKEKSWLKSNPAISRLARFKSADDVEEIEEHPFLDLMASINTWENSFETFEKTGIFLDCTGNAYWMIATGALGIPENIFILPSQWVKVVPGDDTLVKGYLYGRTNLSQIPLTADQVIHFKYPNPHDLYYGMGCIKGMIKGVDRYNALDDQDAALLQNSAIPPFMVRYKSGSLTKEQRKEVEAEWNNALRGVHNAGKTKVADNDWEIERLSLTPAEMGFEFGRKWTRLEIADAFGVPVALLDVENVNMANAKVAMYQYQKFTVLPRLRRIEQKINEQLLPRYGEPRLFVAFDNPVPEDSDYVLKRDTAYLQNGVMTPNEIRQREGMDPIEGGDEVREPSGSGSPFLAERPQVEESRGASLRRAKVHDHSGCSKARQPPLSENEKKIKSVLLAIWAKQKLEAAKKMRAGDLSSDWLLADKWAQEIATLSRAGVESEFLFGAQAGARAIGMSTNLAPWIEQPQVRSWVDGHTFKFAKSVNDTIHAEFKTSLQEGLDMGETISDLTKRMEAVFEGTEREARGEMIARTESIRASNSGTLMQWKESGVVEAKIWDASKGDACPICLELDGTVIDISKAFDEEVIAAGGDADYETIGGPPAHPNCRCSLLPVLTEEYRNRLEESDEA